MPLKAVLIGLAMLAASQADAAQPPSTPRFANPQIVTIRGYSGDSMEPFLTRDGGYLFFNDSNSAPVTKLYWATRIDDVTFQFQGEIGGVNSGALDAVPSMDSNNNFYFVSTRSYPQTLSTIYSGQWSNGLVSNAAVVPGVSRMEAGIVDFDAEVSADGNTLYFSEGKFVAGSSVPRNAEILFATRTGTGFVRAESAKRMMHRVNAARLDYAADTSANELELFFTRLESSGPAIYVSTRRSVSDEFGKPEKISAITGFSEAPSISPDGKSLYYHHKYNDAFHIYRVTRP